MTSEDYEFFSTGAVLSPTQAEEKKLRKAEANHAAEAAFARLFTTQDGEFVLGIIRDSLGARQHDLGIHPDPNYAIKRETMRSVYFWIEELIRRGGERLSK